MSVAFVPDLRPPILEHPGKNPLPFTPKPSPGRRVGQFDLVGTAHFTRRSVREAVMSASSQAYSSVALELDRRRYDELDASAYLVPDLYRPLAEGEFLAAADAFGNRDGDIWLIDMSLDEIRDRIARRIEPGEIRRWAWASSRLAPHEAIGVSLWEAGREHEAMRYLDISTRVMREYAPAVYRVLIEERNLLMAARLQEASRVAAGKTLVLVGKAHVSGMGRLLAEPGLIPDGLRRHGLNYSPPTRIRRARIN